MIFWRLILTLLLILFQILILYVLINWNDLFDFNKLTWPSNQSCQSNQPQIQNIESSNQPTSNTCSTRNKRYCFDLPIPMPQVRCTTSYC